MQWVNTEETEETEGLCLQDARLRDLVGWNMRVGNGVCGFCM